MRLLFVTSEVFPLAKTGGLADVSHALPSALQRHGLDVRILMPAYPQALSQAAPVREVFRFGDPFGWGDARILETALPNSPVPVWMIDCPALYGRSGGLYQDEDGRDWSDNHLRYGLLAHVAAALANEAGGAWAPDIIHANDWHAGLVPLLLRPDARKRTAIVFGVHNLAYQGLFDPRCFDELNLPESGFRHLEFHGRLCFLKAGIETADAVVTVSPCYAGEILSPEYGCGLDGVLRNRPTPPIGILNGIDTTLWDPARDPHLPAQFSEHAMSGKQACKRAIQEALGLDGAADAPLVAYTSRLTHQKMPDVVLESLPLLVDSGAQFALVAEGEAAYEAAFRAMAAQYPGRVAVKIGYNEPDAHRLLAGADMLLHPSRYEPCGLVPLYAMRYGTVPVVRRCGGLADTVVATSEASIRDRSATGFAFDGTSADALTAAVAQAIAHYRQPLAWRRIRAAAMARDFGWPNAAKAYAALYSALARTECAQMRRQGPTILDVPQDLELTDAQGVLAQAR